MCGINSQIEKKEMSSNINMKSYVEMSKSLVSWFFNTVYTKTCNIFYKVIFLFYFLEKTRTTDALRY